MIAINLCAYIVFVWGHGFAAACYIIYNIVVIYVNIVGSFLQQALVKFTKWNILLNVGFFNIKKKNGILSILYIKLIDDPQYFKAKLLQQHGTYW